MERDYLSSLLNLFHRRISKIFVCLLIFVFSSCDFDSPSNFVVPTWFIDIKLPLVSKTFPMGNLVDTTNFIYPTDDSVGFQLIFKGDIEPPVATEETDLYVPFEGGYIEQEIPPDPIAGIDGSAIPIPPITLPIDLSSLVLYNQPVYPDTQIITIGGITDTNRFQLPLQDTVVMFGSAYNRYFVNPVNQVLSAILDSLNGLEPISLGLSSLISGVEPQIISSVDSLIISGTDASPSYFSSYFQNRGYPTNLVSPYARFIGGNESLNDTIVDHDTTSVPANYIFQTYSDLSGEGLTENLKITTSFQLETVHPDSLITLYPEISDSMYIKSNLVFNISGIDSAKVTIDSVNLDLTEQLEAIKSQLSFGGNLPEVEGTTLEIKSALMESSGIPITANKFTVSDLQSTFPWNMKFYLNIPNFVPPSDGEPVLIDRILKNTDDPYDKEILLRGHTLQSTDPDSAIGSLELDLQVIIPTQKATIPLDNTSLGGFGVTIRFGSLYFNELRAFIFKELTADTMDIAGYPSEMSGIGFPGLKFEFELINEINIPLIIDINMIGTTPSGESVITRLQADIATPDYFAQNHSISTDSVKTVIRWDKNGTTIYKYDSPNNWTVVDSASTPPNPGEFSIIDFFASMPLSAVAQTNVRLDGTGGISASAKKIGGSFNITMPFEVTMNAPPFVPPTGISKLEEFDHGTRNKIRHSLIHSEITTNVINSLPVGGDFAILLSDQPYFPKDITIDALNAFRDTMITKYNWDSTDVLYIVDNCDSLSPAKGDIYSFNVMSDSSQCVNGMKYLVKKSVGASVDTVISYVDTLFRVLLPSPQEYYSDTSAVGHPGQVSVPGITSYTSVIDTSRIFLLTDYGSHYTVPRFSFNQTGDQSVFFSKYDEIDIKSFITFRVASSGVLGKTENDIVLLYPNGGETLFAGTDYIIRWKTYGEVSNINIHYALGENVTDDQWQEIESNISNIDSLAWTPSIITDSLRIRIQDSNSELNDISGWYFSISGGQNFRNSSPINLLFNNTIINNTETMRK